MITLIDVGPNWSVRLL